MISMIIYCSLCLWIYMFQPYMAILLGIYFLFFKSFKFKILFVCIFILFTLRLNLNLCEPIQKGYVVEINRKSIIVNHNFTNVSVSVHDVSNYALRDEVILYQIYPLEYSPHRFGFNAYFYTKSRNVCFSSKEEDTYRIEGKGVFNWLSKGGLNQEKEFKRMSRILLFQSNPNEDIDLFISMGVLYTSLIKLVELCFLRVKNRYYELVCISLILFYIGVNLSFPLSLIRVCIFYITSKTINDRLLRFGINCLLCAFISPFGLTQLSFVLPLLLQLSSLFLPMKSRFIQRFCVIILVFIGYNHSFSLLSIMIYPLLFIIYRILLVFTLIGVFIPYFNDIYFLLINHLNNFIKLTQNILVLKGHITYLFIFVFILIYHFTLRFKHHSLISLIGVILGIPLFSLPLFYTVTLINVGQGDSILIQSPFNLNVILIDTGSPFQENVLKTYLNAQVIYKIDHLVITHDDSDHSGNRLDLQNKYMVEDVVLKGRDIQLDYLYLNHLEFEQVVDDDNDLSLIYSLDLYSKRFLFMGDLSMGGERKLIHHYPNLKADLIKIGHHGSNTSTSDDFLKQIQAHIALIGVGKNNYGHPSKEVISRLNDYYYSIFDTYNNGDIKILALPFVYLIIDSNNQFYIFR